MRRIVRWSLPILVLAALLHVLTIIAIPRIIMGRAIAQLAMPAGYNTLYHPARISAASRAIVRPSPDLAYSICVFDVSTAPLRITSPIPHDYLSISLFADNTDNFFVVNDRQVASSIIDLVLIGPQGAAPAIPAGAQLVRAPSTRGVVLMRRVIPSDAAYERIDAERHQATCGPLQ